MHRSLERKESTRGAPLRSTGFPAGCGDWLEPWGDLFVLCVGKRMIYSIFDGQGEFF